MALTTEADMRWTRAARMLILLPTAVFRGPTNATPQRPTFPPALVAETKSLEFHVSTPSTGSLDVQVRAALRELITKNRGARLVKLRVFAVGAADLDSCRGVIARTLGESKTPLPALSLVGVAGFPETTQRVEIESTGDGRRADNPDGVGFIAGLASPSGDRTIAGVARVAREAGIPAANVSRVSCFYEQPDQVAPARAAIASTFPSAEASFVFSYASSTKPAIECEAMSRLSAPQTDEIRYFNLPGGPASPNYSHATLVSTPTVVFVGNETALDATTASIRAALEGAKASVARVGASLSNVVMGDNYWLTDAARDTIRQLRPQYFAGRVPAATGVFFTSLPDRAAGVGIEVVVAIPSAPRDTITVVPGSPVLDGRYLQGHRAELIETTTRAGVTTRTQHFVVDKTVMTNRGRDVFRLQLDALPDAPDTSLHIDVQLDHRTMTLLHREERDRTGRRLVVDMDGTRVTEMSTAGRDQAAESGRFALREPAFLASFLDAAANATSLHEGQLLRIPAFGLGVTQREVAWHSLRVVGRDTVRVQDHAANAWVVEELSGPSFSRRTMWLIREPPYFPRVETYLDDGSFLRTEQRLLDGGRPGSSSQTRSAPR
jgi:enamine deaminase RidA (YjgF/YER057c/UK114 family)